MYEIDRLRHILNILSEDKSASVQMLAEKLYVSAATVRRDLNILEKQGQVRRVFGGVILMENDHAATAFHGRSTKASELDEIAQTAATHIKSGDTIMLDASSTACAIIPHLKRFRNLTIITNSAVSTAGLQDLDAQVFVTGGFMPKNSQGHVGFYAEEMIRNFKADILFFTCAGLAADGCFYDKTDTEASMHKIMMRHSLRRILLCDSGKFCREPCYAVAHLDDIDVLISDAPFTGVGKEKQFVIPD